MGPTLLHFSDSHGRVPSVPDTIHFDVVVCSGDLLPDIYTRRADRERLNLPISLPGSPQHQEQWLRTQLPKFQALARGKPFLFCPGNHDFYDPIPVLRDAGIEAHNLTGQVVTAAGIRFYGFPYCPWAGGAFNYELKPPEMQARVDEVVRLLGEDAFDVLVAHCPPYKMLDTGKNGQVYGNARMLKAILDMPPEKLPRAYLCGHVHASKGDAEFRGMYVSNAATTVRVIPSHDD